MARSYRRYQAHELRQGVVHAGDEGLVVLLGPLRITPGAVAEFTLESPAAYPADPMIDVRFVSMDDIDRFILGCDDGQRPYPPDFESYPAAPLDVERSEHEVELTDDRPGRFVEAWEGVRGFSSTSTEMGIISQALRVEAPAEEGAFVFRVQYSDDNGEAQEFVVVVHSKTPTRFPQDHDDDLTDLLYRGVNLSEKNGRIWFVEPIYFVEQHLGVTLAEDVIEEMVTCEGLPPDLPADDSTVVRLQWGWGHHGLRRIRLDVDPLELPEPCEDKEAITVADAVGIEAQDLAEAVS